MAKEELEEKQEDPPKKESPMGFLMALVLVTVVAVGAGWYLGGLLGQPADSDRPAETAVAKEQKKGKSEDKADPKAQTLHASGGPVMVLEPIIVALRKSNNVYLRLELAVVGGKDASFNEATKLKIGSEVAAFAQTLTLQQISGPSGYLHFREDVLDRARLSTEGQVEDVYILSMVAE